MGSTQNPRKAQKISLKKQKNGPHDPKEKMGTFWGHPTGSGMRCNWVRKMRHEELIFSGKNNHFSKRAKEKFGENLSFEVKELFLRHAELIFSEKKNFLETCRVDILREKKSEKQLFA